MIDPFAPVGETLSEVWNTYAPLLAVLVCLIPVFIFDAMRLSNRFTGPVYRLRQATRQLAEGETPDRVEFRGADYWKDLAKDFNHIIQRLREAESQNQAPSETA